MLRNGRWFWLILLAVILFIASQLYVQAQHKIVSKQTKIGIDSIEETLLIEKGMVAARTIAQTGLKNHLENIKLQLETYNEGMKFVKSPEQFEQNIPRVSALCNSVVTLDKMLEILSPQVRREFNSHLKVFRKSLDEIVLLYLKHSSKEVNKFVRMEREELAPYYLALVNYHNEWKKSYEF